MPEIIGPDGKTYYSADHFDSPNDQKNDGASKPPFKLDSITDYVYLVGGIVAILRGLRLLADLAVGLILLFLGSTGVNYWMVKNR